MKTLLNKILKIIGFVIPLSVLFIGISLFAEWITNDPSFNVIGVNFYVVGSESMARVDHSNVETLEGMRAGFLQVDDVVVTSKLRSSDRLSIGDIVTYVNEDGLTIIHRIVDVRSVDGQTLYYTRGDANNVNDPRPLKRNDISGIFLFRIPYFGEIAFFLKSRYGISAIIIAIFLNLLAEYFRIAERENSDPLYSMRT